MQKQVCWGANWIVSVLRDPKGHDLRMARTVEAELTTMWCATCGAFATPVPQQLRKPCRGMAVLSGHVKLKAFRRGSTHSQWKSAMSISRFRGTRQSEWRSLE